jgi:hypothetical protein
MQRNSWLGWDHLGMVREARGDTRQAADCYRKVIDFIRQRRSDLRHQSAVAPRAVDFAMTRRADFVAKVRC